MAEKLATEAYVDSKVPSFNKIRLIDMAPNEVKRCCSTFGIYGLSDEMPYGMCTSIYGLATYTPAVGGGGTTIQYDDNSLGWQKPFYYGLYVLTMHTQKSSASYEFNAAIKLHSPKIHFNGATYGYENLGTALYKSGSGYIHNDFNNPSSYYGIPDQYISNASFYVKLKNSLESTTDPYYFSQFLLGELFNEYPACSSAYAKRVQSNYYFWEFIKSKNNSSLLADQYFNTFNENCLYTQLDVSYISNVWMPGAIYPITYWSSRANYIKVEKTTISTLSGEENTLYDVYTATWNEEEEKNVLDPCTGEPVLDPCTGEVMKEIVLVEKTSEYIEPHIDNSVME